MTESAFPLVQSESYPSGASTLPAFPGVVGSQLATIPEPPDFVTADHCALQSSHTHGPVVIPELTIVIDPVGLTVLKADHSPVAVLPWAKLSRLEVIGRAELPNYGQSVVLVADTVSGRSHTFVVPVSDPGAFHRRVQQLTPGAQSPGAQAPAPTGLATAPSPAAPAHGFFTHAPSTQAPLAVTTVTGPLGIVQPEPVSAPSGMLAQTPVAPGAMICLGVALVLAVVLLIVTFG